MQYRTFGSVDFAPSALGFGAMRLPLLDASLPGEGPLEGRIDRKAATHMLRWAIDHGVNYVDTAYVYHDGRSEEWLGEALADGYRERVKIATKMPVWKVETPAGFDPFLDEQLERLQVPSIDFYLLHALERETWRKALELGALDWARGAIADGRIGHIGFSFHDQYDVFEEIVDGGEGVWEFCQIQLNYMDADYQAGLRGLRYAADHGLGVVVMEPLRGGRLAKAPPPDIQEIMDSAAVHRSPVEWALQWVWDLPQVSLLLSGMGTVEEVQQNVDCAERSGAAVLGAGDLQIVERVRDTYRERMAVDCTGCRYCSPCPNGVDIAAVLEAYNDAFIYQDVDTERFAYTWIDESARGDKCAQCGECEERCPQMLAVGEWLQRADELLRPPGGA